MKKKTFIKEMPFHLMLLPAVIILLIYNYIPMMGSIIAFEKFRPAKGILGSDFIGFKNFIYIFNMPDFTSILWNTTFIAIMKILTELFIPLIIALLLNEIISKFYKRTIQTIIYMPHFLSWVILGGILVDILSPSNGIINKILVFLGFKEIFFLGDPKAFPFTIVLTNIWKEAGFKTIIYLAALTGIDMSLYEAAVIDGAGRWKQTLYVTLPGIVSTVILLATLSLGNVLNAGFDQIFNLYSPLVYSTGDVIDTFVYRLGLVDLQYGPATAIGLFKSVISFILISVSYKLANKYANYKIF